MNSEKLIILKNKFEKIIDKIDIKIFLLFTLILNLTDILLQKSIISIEVFSNIFISTIILMIYYTHGCNNKTKNIGVISLFYISIITFLTRRIVLPNFIAILLLLPFAYIIFYFLTVIFDRYYRK